MRQRLLVLSLTPSRHCRFRLLSVKFTSPLTAFSEVRTQRSADMSWYIQAHAAGTDLLTCLIFRVQNPLQRMGLVAGMGTCHKKKGSMGHLAAKLALVAFSTIFIFIRTTSHTGQESNHLWMKVTLLVSWFDLQPCSLGLRKRMAQSDYSVERFSFLSNSQSPRLHPKKLLKSSHDINTQLRGWWGIW